MNSQTASVNNKVICFIEKANLFSPNKHMHAAALTKCQSFGKC